MTTHGNDLPTLPLMAGPLTVAEVSASFGVSVSTIRRLLNENKLPNATKRRGVKGDEWVIPADDMTTLGYELVGLHPRGEGTDPTLVALVSDYEKKLADLRRQHETELAKTTTEHERLLTVTEDKHKTEVDSLTKEADYERQLRESAQRELSQLEKTSNVTGHFAASLQAQLEQAQKRVLELETATAKKRWLRKRAKADSPQAPAPDNTP